jgi:hypothetical protein
MSVATCFKLARLWLWSGLLLGLLLAGRAQAQEDPPGRVGRVAAVQGEVWVFEPEQGAWVAALANRPFTGGDRVATGPGSSVEVRVGSTLLLLGSQAELQALRLDDERMQLRLERGSLGLLLRSNEAAAELELDHPEARFMPRRAGLYRIDRREGLSEAVAMQGDLQVDGHNLEMTLYTGQRAAFWRDGALGDTRSQWLGPLVDDFALALQTLELGDARSAAAHFVPPEMTGAEDLDRHGRWQQHPEYGPVWAPSIVAVDWVPYRQGQWVWLRPWGWTWVDDAPWGFAPFHYGRWLWWGNRWCWTPGPRVARPVFAPALVGWVGGPQFSVAIGSRTVPAVGWLPLGPRDPFRPGYSASPGHLRRLNPHLPHPPQGTLPQPIYANRSVPGALTLWPGSAPTPRQPVAAAALRADEMALRRLWQAENLRHDAPGRPPSPARDYTPPRAMAPLPGGTRSPVAAQAPQSPTPTQPAAPAVPAAPGPFYGRPAAAEPGPPQERTPRPVTPTPPAAGPTRPAPPVLPPQPPMHAAPAGPAEAPAPAPGRARPFAPNPPAAGPSRPVPPTSQAPERASPAAPLPAAAPGAAPGAAPAPAPARAQPPAPNALAATPPRPAGPPRDQAEPPRSAGQGLDPGERRRTPESRGTPRER